MVKKRYRNEHQRTLDKRLLEIKEELRQKMSGKEENKSTDINANKLVSAEEAFKE